MSMNEAIERIGSHVLFNTSEGLKFWVRILDAKTAYGNIHFRIIPVNGHGEKWVDSSRLNFN